MRAIILLLLLAGCSATVEHSTVAHIDTASNWLGLHEHYDRQRLRNFMGVDPVVTEWCAAFVNSVLHTTGTDGSETVHPYPLMARSFLRWGVSVDPLNISIGDIVVFPRGTEGWQGHVGFYLYTVYIEGDQYWAILGGNQSQSVSVELYDPAAVLSVRRSIDQKEVSFDKTRHTAPYDASFGPV